MCRKYKYLVALVKVMFIWIFVLGSLKLYAQDSAAFYLDLYRTVQPGDSANLERLEKSRLYFEKQGNIAKSVEVMVAIADEEGGNGNYGKSYSAMWEALILAEEIQDVRLQFLVHTRLGRLYDVFHKPEDSFKHVRKTLEFAKLGQEQGVVEERAVISAYFSYVQYYSRKSDFVNAMAYLDTCHIIAEKFDYTYDEKAYLFAEYGRLLLLTGANREALEELQRSALQFERIDPNYLTLIYYYIGLAYERLNNITKSEKYYRKSLDNLLENYAHFDVKPEVLSRLSQSLFQQGKYLDAYKLLSESKELNERLFSSKSAQNADLLAVRNVYDEQVRKKDVELLQKDKEIAVQRAVNLRIRLILIVVVALVFAGGLLGVFYFQKKKYRSEKQKTKHEAEIKQAQNEAAVELKNKELTSFVLRLIDKDSLIKEIELGIKKHAPNNRELLELVDGKMSQRQDLWEEFDKRFVDVNKEFYAKLKDKFPELTPTEIKHCALIKLNFTAKEMAQLLNISLHGINTSRYRIRKKMKLEKGENLGSFIASL